MNWSPLALAAATGALGGLVLDVVQDRTLDLPRLRRGGVYMGFLSDALAGAVGGLLAYGTMGPRMQITPELLLHVLSGSGVAGYLKAAGYNPRTMGR